MGGWNFSALENRPRGFARVTPFLGKTLTNPGAKPFSTFSLLASFHTSHTTICFNLHLDIKLFYIPLRAACSIGRQKSSYLTYTLERKGL